MCPNKFSVVVMPCFNIGSFCLIYTIIVNNFLGILKFFDFLNFYERLVT